jgi:hypothetical protein
MLQIGIYDESARQERQAELDDSLEKWKGIVCP